MWSDIPGWFNFEDIYREVVRRAPKDAILVEVGVALGRSLGFLANECDVQGRKDLVIIAVDPWERAETAEEPYASEYAKDRGDSFKTFQRMVTTHMGSSACRFQAWRITSKTAAEIIGKKNSNLRPWFVFVDADHSYEGVKADIEAWRPLIVPGGILAGHDYDSNDFPGVVRAVIEAFGPNCRRPPSSWLVEDPNRTAAMKNTALAIPHAPWAPNRINLMSNLRNALEQASDGTFKTTYGAKYYKEFADKEPWMAWFTKIIRWFTYDTDCDHLLVLQDDVEIAPNFWPALRAMQQAWPSDPICLAATHSAGPEVARQGRHSYLCPNVVGWGWLIPRAIVELLCKDISAVGLFHEQRPNDGEDTFLAQWLTAKGHAIRHPVPTIVDHLHVQSTNEGFDNHTHRRSTVTWREYSPSDMADPNWWKTTATVLPLDLWRRCHWCGEKEVDAVSVATGIGLCAKCALTPYRVRIESSNAALLEKWSELHIKMLQGEAFKVKVDKAISKLIAMPLVTKVTVLRSLGIEFAIPVSEADTKEAREETALTIFRLAESYGKVLLLLYKLDSTEW